MATAFGGDGAVQRGGFGGPGRPQGAGVLPDAQRQSAPALAEIVEARPIPAALGVLRWHPIDRAQWVQDELEWAPGAGQGS